MLGCNRPLPEEDFISFIKDPKNGLLHEKTVNGVTYRVYYRPTDMVVKQLLLAQDTISKDVIDSLRKEYEGLLYFALSLSRGGGDALESLSGNRATYSAMVQQMAFGLNQKVLLTTSTRDTLQLVNYVFPRTYGYSTSADILFAFEAGRYTDAEWISLLVEEFGLKTGDMRFKFYTKNIKKAPRLKF
jgi:hypothetical protein